MRGGFRSGPRWVRLTSYAVGLLLLALVGASVVAVTAVRRSFPTTDGTLALAGLDAKVTVRRDDAGVPQVYADTSHDLFYAQGFVQAQDRFFEMDVRRHLTAGRLSELFGRDALDTDKVVRTLGWRRVAERELSLLSPETLDHLQDFSEGVNAYLHSHAPSEISLEYTLLSVSGRDVHVEDWTPLDSVAWLKAMAWDLRGNMQDEVERATDSTRLDPDQIAELFPAYPYDRNRPIVETGPDTPSASENRDVGTYTPPMLDALGHAEQTLADLPQVIGSGGGVGSNAWAVAGAHTTTGKPLLANDPHLAPSLPGVWYQMGLHCTRVTDDCPYDVAGFTFAGFPAVVIGHNADIAWGFTNLGPDVSDLYLEAVDGDRYLRGRHYRTFEERTETIKIAGEDPYVFTVRSSVHGPLLSDVSGTYASVGANAPVRNARGRVLLAPDRGTGYAVALAWTALTPGRTADAVFLLDRARDWNAFRAAARAFAVPSQNLVYADRAGHIGYQAPGAIPVRRSGNDGRWPAAGWVRANDWTGRTVPFDALPSVLDPADGFVVTANQAVTGPGYPYFLGDPGTYGYRSQRIVDLLGEGGPVSPAAMSAIQLDTRNGFAPTLVPALLRLDPGSRYYRVAQRLLRRWDFTQPAGSAAAAYYNAVWRNLLRLTFADQLPASTMPDGEDRWFEVVRTLLEQPGSDWWDDVDTPEREGRDDILLAALRDARDELVRRQSRRVDGWSWGRLHTLRLENTTLGRSGNGIAERLLDRGPWQLGGGSSVVDATGWDASQGYEVTWVPSMRMVVSLADLDDSTWVNLTGASGHAFSAHYTDQTELWAAGRTRSWPFSAAAVAKATQDTLRLVPDTDPDS